MNSLAKDRLIDECLQENKRFGWKLTTDSYERQDEEIAQNPDWGGDKRIIEDCRIKQWGFCPGCPVVLSKRPDVDHIRAKSRGGTDSAENKQLLCPACNRRRGNRSFEDFVRDRLADGSEWTDYPPDEE